MNIANNIEHFANEKGVIYHADALEVLQQIPNGSIDLIFVDPPYNIGKNFAGRKDRWSSDEEYLKWCYSWIDLCIAKLKPSGAFYVMTSTQFMSYFDIYIREKMTIFLVLYGYCMDL